MPIKIDVDSVIRQRLPRYYRFIPRFMIRWLENTICQDGLNSLLSSNDGRQGCEFCHGVLSDLNITYDVINPQLLPHHDDRRVIFVSNHPLGALDGIAYIDMIGSKYGPDLHFIVNDLLMAVEPLRNVFVPINKHGRQNRSSSKSLDEAFAGPDPVLIFPAGLCSRKGADGKISDLKWQKMFVNKAIEHRRDIIPLHFDGENSPFFYNFAHLRGRTGLRFNLEMIYLPREIFRAKGSHFNFTVGERIPWHSLKGGSEALKEAAGIREIVYSIRERS